MNKLFPYWGRSPQPGQTYYLQKVSYVFGVVDHREGGGHVYHVSEIYGPKIWIILCPTSFTTRHPREVYLGG